MPTRLCRFDTSRIDNSENYHRRNWWMAQNHPEAPQHVLLTLSLISAWISIYIHCCGMNVFIHSQTSTVQPSGLVFPSHTWLGMLLLFHVGFKLIHVDKRVSVNQHEWVKLCKSGNGFPWGLMSATCAMLLTGNIIMCIKFMLYSVGIKKLSSTLVITKFNG